MKMAVIGSGSTYTPELVEGPHEFLSALNMLPSSYLKYFYLTDETLRDLKSQEKTRAQQVMEIEAALLEKYKDSHLARSTMRTYA